MDAAPRRVPPPLTTLADRLLPEGERNRFGQRRRTIRSSPGARSSTRFSTEEQAPRVEAQAPAPLPHAGIRILLGPEELSAALARTEELERRTAAARAVRAERHRSAISRAIRAANDWPRGGR